LGRPCLYEHSIIIRRPEITTGRKITMRREITTGREITMARDIVIGQLTAATMRHGMDASQTGRYRAANVSRTLDHVRVTSTFASIATTIFGPPHQRLCKNVAVDCMVQKIGRA
jgi:hypothetical protein